MMGEQNITKRNSGNGLRMGCAMVVGLALSFSGRDVAAQNAPCALTFTQADYEHCTAVCDSEHGDRVRNLPTEEFNCARQRDIEMSNVNAPACFDRCNRENNPDSFDEGQCHSDCDRQADERVRACNGNAGCEGWADGDGRRGCHAGCSGRHNQIVANRLGCHNSCNGMVNAIRDRFNGCVAGVAGRRIQSERMQNGCRLACGERRNAASRAYEACQSATPRPRYTVCVCDNGDGTTRQVPIEVGRQCSTVCVRPLKR